MDRVTVSKDDLGAEEVAEEEGMAGVALVAESSRSPGIGELAGTGQVVERVLGRVEGDSDGPTLVCVAGIHGNEAAGVRALQRVLERLRERRADLRGRLVGLAGNREALRAGQRFLDMDLNRAWTDQAVGPVSGEAKRTRVTGAERQERAELLEALEAALAGDGTAYVVDLHTTSGPGGVFTTVSDTISNRTFALQLPVPLILGLQERVDGTLLGYLGDRGHVTLSLESGQHDEPRAVDRAIAGIWIAIATAGLLQERAIPELAEARAMLAGDSRGLPRVLEIRYRHPVAPEDGFVMRDGYRNFQTIREGELLGSDHRGEVRSPERGRILMPLYQELGEDGFFVVREIHPFWLRLSEVLRRWRVDRWIHWLPGVAKDRSR